MGRALEIAISRPPVDGDVPPASSGAPPPAAAGPGQRYKPPTVLTAGLVLLFIVFVLSLFVNEATIGDAVLAIVLGACVIGAGYRLRRPTDAHWLPMGIAAGFLAKMVAAGARYWVLINLYRGIGDAKGYHGDGLSMADTWRSLSVPEIGVGTDFMGPATGLLYVPYKPTLLGGFFIFATLAFIGQLLMVVALRHVASARHFRWYLLSVFFMPTVAYWPASIGKEALMFFFMGPVAYGAARLLTQYQLRWAIPIAIGLAGAGAVRAHMALLLAAALVLAVIVGKAPPVAGASAKRVLLLGITAVVLVAAVLATGSRFGLDLSAGVSAEVVTDEIDPFLTSVSDRTNTGGSAVEGSVISSPAEVPEATLRVLFSPLPWEATSSQTLAASLEGFALLVILVLRLPTIIKGLRHARRMPYAFFSLMFTGGFIFAFSAILNLGILARQRSQVMPFLLVVLVVMGFPDKASKRQATKVGVSAGAA